MNPKWAEENLQTIRTLMERSALYRRALAPIMTFVGVMGIAGGLAGWRLQIKSGWAFVAFWSGVAAVALGGAFFLVRRQALKDSEPLWSPPTKRVAQALIPPFTIAAFLASVNAYWDGDAELNLLVIPVWCWAYGCAMCAAGAYMPRGAKLFGWMFIIIGCALLIMFIAGLNSESAVVQTTHLLMGGIFGGLHLAYGIYLYFTEKKSPDA